MGTRSFPNLNQYMSGELTLADLRSDKARYFGDTLYYSKRTYFKIQEFS